MSHRIYKTWIFQASLTAVLYYLTGHLGILLALPPVYATLAWPPFGISIAALLLFGINRWPGVLIGAFFISSIQTHYLSSALIPLGIATGNTVAAIFAALLIKKILQFPKRFYSEREIILFLLISGPLSALISSSTGVSLLYYSEVVLQTNLMTNWIYWFVGDAIGGLIFAPLALMLSAQSRSYWIKSVTKVLIPVFISFALILLVSQYLSKSEHERYSAEFNRKAEFTYNALEKDLNSNIDMLISLKSFFDNSTTVTSEEFRDFANIFHSRKPEVQALAWIPLNADNSKKFQIEYIEPNESTSRAAGESFGSYERRQDLLQRAFKTKQIIASSPFDISGIHDNSRSIYLLFAIGRPQGVLLEVMRLDGVLKNLTDVLSDPSYRVLIEDVTNSNQRELIIDTLASTDQEYSADFKWSSILKVGDRQWEFTFQKDSLLGSGSFFDSAVFLFTSLAFIFLICALLLTIASRIITVEEIVDEKTQHLIDLNLQLKKASETKSEFLANMSHEIRTPLNVIVGMFDLLEEAPLNTDQKHYVEIAKKSSQNLLTIINDILDISKIEAGLITLERTEVNLHDLVTEITEMFALKAREKHLTLSVSLDKDTQGIYLADPTRIRQVLSNLISNSLKFTTTGSIHIELKRNHTGMNGNLVFHVNDTGIGIPQDKIPQLFQPFTQADSTITRKFGGTGLGLSISKRLVNMMKGDITLESELNHGSRISFTLDLPWLRNVAETTDEMSSTPKKDLISVDTSNQRPLSILVVDDTDDNRLLIKAYLKNTAHKISEASNGLQAFEMAKTEAFDLILMDMQMPIMDGFTATRQIRHWEMENNHPATAIWALTAYALQNEIDRSLSAGCNKHLTKPLRKDVLLEHVRHLSADSKTPPQRL